MHMYMHINQKEFVVGTGKLGGGRKRREYILEFDLSKINLEHSVNFFKCFLSTSLGRKNFRCCGNEQMKSTWSCSQTTLTQPRFTKYLWLAVNPEILI